MKRVKTQKNYRPGSIDGTTVLEVTMLVATTNGIIHVMGTWIRRADGRLASSAARNAADQVAFHGRRRLEDARTRRDLRNPRLAETFTPMARHRVSGDAVH
jgi:hypothetical protein